MLTTLKLYVLTMRTKAQLATYERSWLFGEQVSDFCQQFLFR